MRGNQGAGIAGRKDRDGSELGGACVPRGPVVWRSNLVLRSVVWSVPKDQMLSFVTVDARASFYCLAW